MTHNKRIIFIGVVVLYLISYTFSLSAKEIKHHGHGRDEDRENGVLQYSQEQSNGDSIHVDSDNIKPEMSSMSNEGFMIVSIIVAAILVIIIIILCICYCPNLFDLVCCCCDLCDLCQWIFSCLPDTN